MCPNMCLKRLFLFIFFCVLREKDRVIERERKKGKKKKKNADNTLNTFTSIMWKLKTIEAKHKQIMRPSKVPD